MRKRARFCVRARVCQIGLNQNSHSYKSAVHVIIPKADDALAKKKEKKVQTRLVEYGSELGFSEPNPLYTLPVNFALEICTVWQDSTDSRNLVPSSSIFSAEGNQLHCFKILNLKDLKLLDSKFVSTYIFPISNLSKLQQLKIKKLTL